MKKFTDTPFWDSTYMPQMWDIYLGEQNSEAFEDKTLCVLKDDFKKEALPMHSVLPASIPDTYIETADFDCLHDEGILYGQRLEKAGAKVEWNDTKATFHGYDMALDTRIVINSVKKRLSFLRRHF